ncbi:SET domain-containing protein [Pilatotrama ljubarskyi]|nr:SET domain-containing protein [Pilatotrama ljubarskyi]
MANQTRRRQASSKPGSEGTASAKSVKHAVGGPSPLRRLVKGLSFLLLAGGVYYYFTRMMWEHEPTKPVEDPEEDAYQVPVIVMKLPGKGMGVVAARNISQGELVLREKPLFVVPHKVTMSPGAVLLASLATLSPARRASFYNLSYVNFPEGIPEGSPRYQEELALAIFQTNAVSAGSQGVGIFPRMARLNHGCSSAFNVVYTWRDDEGVLVVHALKPLMKGEELLTTYTNTKRPRHVRREFLREHYGFDCQCSVCTLPDDLSALSDQRLTAMTDLYARFSSWQHEGVSGKEAIETAISIWRLGEEDGYWSERGQLAADVTHVAAAHADVSAAREWARLSRRWYAYELGGDSTQAREMERVAAQPQLHGAWGKRRPETVGGPEPWMSAS